MKVKIRTVKFVILIIFIVIALLFIKYISDNSIITPMGLRDKMFEYGIFAPLIFVLIYILLTLFLFPGTPLTIASGILFGTFMGTFYTLIAATIGATLAFILSRYLGRVFISEVLEEKYEKLKEYENYLKKSGIRAIIFLRIIPLFPFNALNFGLGLTKVRLKGYMLGTFIGIIPGVFALAYFGDSITELSTLNIVLSSLLFILLIFSPKIYKFLKGKLKGKNK